MKKANIISSIIGMGVAGYVWVAASHFKQFKNVPVGPEFFPKILAVALFLLCFILLIQSILKKDDTKAPTLNFFAKNESGKDLRRMLIVIGITFVLAFLWETLGFLIATPIAVFAVQFILGNRKWGIMAIYSIGVTLVIFAAFKFLLGIDMPMGFIEYYL